MSAALELIRTVEANGGRFRVDGEYLVIAPGEAAAPVMEELRQHKAELLAELARRPAMPAGVRLVSWNPKAAPVRLSECSTVTDTEKFIRATLMQLEAALEGKGFYLCVLQVTRQSLLGADQGNRLAKRAADVTEFHVLAGLDAIEHFGDKLRQWLRQTATQLR